MNATYTDTYRPRRALSPAGVAYLLDISERHLLNLRETDPTFPAPRILGTQPRWDEYVIHDWVAEASRTDRPTETDAPAATTPAAKASKKKPSGKKANPNHV